MPEDSKEHIGPLLAKQRESLKLSLDAVYKRTRIAPHFLDALEKERFDQFPAEVYLIGFLKQYAKFLGLDPEQAVQSYKDLKQVSPPVAPNSSVGHDIPHTVPHSVHTGAKSHSTWLIFPFLALVVAVVWSYLASQKEEVPPVVIQEVVVSSATASGGSVSPAVPDVPAAVSGPLVLEAVARVSCWLRVRSDGQMIFEGILPEGTRHQWQAKKEFIVRSGYVEGVSLLFNGQPVDLAKDARNHVNEVTLKK